ncbi:MAG: glycosyltransferase family 4 protein [Candidatus Dadabacteria bacterium]|nr:glycosyltransferase family 4 protein [Candidatus Dadabacteria bacterium]
MRIAYVGSPELFLRGASPIHVMKMCQAMANLGIDVELILQSYDKKYDIFEFYGVRPNFKIITTIPSTNTYARHFIHGTYSAFYTWFKKSSYDLILTRNIIYTYLSTVFFKIPTIYDAHHPLVNTAARYLFDSFKNSKYLIRFSTNSCGLGNIYTSLGLPEYKLVVAHNGVDLERFENVPNKFEARKQLSLDTQKKIVCYSGNIYSGRGIELLMEVVLRLNDVLFLIVGGLESDIEYYRNIARKKKAENFKLVGFVPHKSVPLYLSSADILVLPYTSSMTIQGGTLAGEFTSPIKLFEYMASSRPIVATAIPSVKEILKDGENALIVEPNSVESLYNGIKRVLEDRVLAERLAIQAFNDAKKYTWEERAKKILNGLYRL